MPTQRMPWMMGGRIVTGSGGGGGGPAAPPVAGYVLWLNSQIGLYQDTGLTTPATANNDVVKGWADQSGLAHNMLEATNPPKLQTAQINGLPVVLFDGTNDKLGPLAFTLAQPCMVYIVFNPLVHLMTKVVYDGFTVATALLRENNSNVWEMYAGSALAAVTGPATASYSITTWKWNGASSAGRINNGSYGTTSPGTASPNGFTLGAAGDSLGWSNIAVAEVIIYPSILSGGDDTSVLNYLNARYATF